MRELLPASGSAHHAAEGTHPPSRFLPFRFGEQRVRVLGSVVPAQRCKPRSGPRGVGAELEQVLQVAAGPRDVAPPRCRDPQERRELRCVRGLGQLRLPASDGLVKRSPVPVEAHHRAHDAQRLRIEPERALRPPEAFVILAGGVERARQAPAPLRGLRSEGDVGELVTTDDRGSAELRCEGCCESVTERVVGPSHEGLL